MSFCITYYVQKYYTKSKLFLGILYNVCIVVVNTIKYMLRYMLRSVGTHNRSLEVYNLYSLDLY